MSDFYAKQVETIKNESIFYSLIENELMSCFTVCQEKHKLNQKLISCFPILISEQKTNEIMYTDIKTLVFIVAIN